MGGINMGERDLLTKLKDVLDELETLEKDYRKIYNSAVDIEEFEISQKTQSDAYFKIRKIKEWKGVVTDLNNTVSESNIIEMPLTDITDHATNKSDLHEVETKEHCEYDSEEQKKIGEYVRIKMRELSNSRFTFSDSDIDVMQEKSWTKKVLGLDYELIRIYNEKYDISEQIKDELGYNRYWKELFNFGKYKILLNSQWFERYRGSFDEWYNKLHKTKNTPKRNLEDTGKTSTYERSGYTCKEPIGLKLFDKTYPIKYWNEVLIKVCEIMLLKKPYIVAKFDKESTLNSEHRINFSYIESDIKVSRKRLSNALWIETNRSANDIIKVSKKILELCGFNESDLTVDFE
jgi:hypothetical protein